MTTLSLRQRVSEYEKLMRLDKPIGILLLLWPTLWALWVASDGRPAAWVVAIFVVGTVLMRYGWPGNIRQLKNAVYRALTQLEGYELRPQDILLPDYDAGTVSVGEEAMEGSLDDITRRFERSVLTQLYRSFPSTRKLAKRLGVSHTAIANKLREYGLSQKKGEE